MADAVLTSREVPIGTPEVMEKEIRGREPLKLFAGHEYAATSYASAADHGVSTAPDETFKAGATADVGMPREVLHTKGAAVSERSDKAGSDVYTRQEEAIVAVEDGVPKDAAARISADLLARATRAAENGEDEEAVECTVMKRGNYWPYFWAQRLLIVERRSLLYFAGPLSASGATPRGFFPLQCSTRILLSFDRVSLYGRTDGLLVGIYNTISPALVTPEPSAAACPHLPPGGPATLGLSSRASFTASRDAQITPTPQQHSQRVGIMFSGDPKEGVGGCGRLNFNSTSSNYKTAGSSSYSAPVTAAPTLFPPLSLLLAPFRWMFPRYSASSGLRADQSSAPDIRAQHVHADLHEMSSAPLGFVSSSRITLGASIKCPSPLSSPPPASPYSVPGLRSSASTSSSLSSGSAALPCFAPPRCLLATDSSHPFLHEGHLSSSTDTGMSVCADLGCTLHSPPVRDGRNKIPLIKYSPRSPPGADGEYWDVEGDSSSCIPFTPSSGTADLSFCSVAPTDASSFSSRRPCSSGSFFSLPSTPSLPLRACSSCSSHSTASLRTFHGPSKSCPPVISNKNSTLVYPPLLDQSSASNSFPFLCPASHSPSSSPPSFSSVPPSVVSSSGFWATATCPPLSKPAFTVLSPSSAPSSPTSIPSQQRRLQASDETSPASDIPSTSSSLLSGSFLSCNVFASPSMGLSRTTSSEKSEALRGGKRTVIEEAQQAVVACEKQNVQPEHVRPQRISDHVQVQQEYKCLEHGHPQLKAERRGRARAGLMSDAPTTLDCGLTAPAALEAVSARIFRATQEDNKRRDVSYADAASCVESASARSSHDSQTGVPVGACASEPPVVLICSQEAFAREFSKAPKPRYLFECADHEQQHRICCAIARSILRIRRQARRKHEKQKQQLHTLLTEGLLKWQQKHSKPRQGCPLDGAGLPQQLPGRLGQLHQLLHAMDEKELNDPQQQRSQRPLGLQDLQTEEMSSEHILPEREQKDPREMFSMQEQSFSDLARSTRTGRGRISFPGSSTTEHISVVGGPSAKAGHQEECRYLPRLLTGWANEDAQTGTPRNVTEMCFTQKNVCSATATATETSARTNTAASLKLCQRRGSEESSLLQSYHHRNQCPLPAEMWNARASEKNYLREPTGGPRSLGGTTTGASAGRRCHSEERVVIPLRFLRGHPTDTEEASIARRVHTVGVRRGTSHTGRRPSPSGLRGEQARQDVFRHSTTSDLGLDTRCAGLRLREAMERTTGAKFSGRSFSNPALSAQTWSTKFVLPQPQQLQLAGAGLTHIVGPFSTGPDANTMQHGAAVAAARQCASYEKGTRRLRRELNVASCRVCSLDAGGDGSRQQQRPSATDTSFRSRAVGNVGQRWSRKSIERSNSSEAHERADFIEIVTDLLEVLESSERMRRIGVCAADEVPITHCLQGHERENLPREKGRHRNVGASNLRRTGKNEYRRKRHEIHLRETERQPFYNDLRPIQQHKADHIHWELRQKASREASPAIGLENRQEREDKSMLEDYHIYVRLVRALVALERSVSRDHAEPLQAGRTQPLFQTNVATFCENTSKGDFPHTGTVSHGQCQRSVSREILQAASEALFRVAQSCALRTLERNCDSSSAGGDFLSRGSDAIRELASPLSGELSGEVRSFLSRVAHGARQARGTDDMSGIGNYLGNQPLAFAAGPTRQHHRELEDFSKQKQQVQCGFSERSLHLQGGSVSLQTLQPDDGGPPWLPQQRLRAVDKLLLEQRDQLERLQSVVDFLLREREVQLRFRYQVNDAELQQHWEAERRNFEAGNKQGFFFGAGCTLQREFDACGEPNEPQNLCEDVLVDAQQKELADRTNERPRGRSDEKGAVVEAPLCGGLKNREITSAGQVQALARVNPSCKRFEWSPSPHTVSCDSPLSEAELKREDKLSGGEKARENGTLGEHDIHSRFSPEGGQLAGGSPKATRVSSNFFLGRDCSATKDDISVLAVLPLEERQLRNVESDAEGQDKQRKEHLATPREFPVIFRISTPPASSGESDVEETVSADTA